LSLFARVLVAIMATLFGVMMCLHGSSADEDKRWFSYAFAGFCFVIALASMATGQLAEFFGSLVGSVVALCGVWYFAHAAQAGVYISSRNEPSLLNACLFLLVFARPAVLYVMEVRFGFRKREQQGSDRDDR
jgi:hypothetical protein